MCDAIVGRRYESLKSIAFVNKKPVLRDIIPEEKASANNIIPKNLKNWKAKFLENVELGMEPSKAVKAKIDGGMVYLAAES